MIQIRGMLTINCPTFITSSAFSVSTQVESEVFYGIDDKIRENLNMILELIQTKEDQKFRKLKT